jgi:hypothetical protein
MKKLLLICGIGILSTSAFAVDNLDMSNLKCGKLQIYSNTTLQDVKTNCDMKKEGWISKQDEKNLPTKYWQGQNKMYEVHFKSTNTKELVRCDFVSNSPDATIVGCR